MSMTIQNHGVFVLAQYRLKKVTGVPGPVGHPVWIVANHPFAVEPV